jgi:DNA-binding XRE family transcriptional regulator
MAPRIPAIVQDTPDDLPMFPLPDAVLSEARHRLANRMRALRKRQSESQAAAAGRVGISETDWQRMEAENREPRLTEVLRIQHAYGVPSLEDFLGDSPSQRLFRDHIGGN